MGFTIWKQLRAVWLLRQPSSSSLQGLVCVGWRLRGWSMPLGSQVVQTRLPSFWTSFKVQGKCVVSTCKDGFKWWKKKEIKLPSRVLPAALDLEQRSFIKDGDLVTDLLQSSWRPPKVLRPLKKIPNCFELGVNQITFYPPPQHTHPKMFLQNSLRQVFLFSGGF